MSELSLETLALAKKYTDEHGGGGGSGGDKISQKTLNAAKEYADGKANDALSDAKTYADGKDEDNLSAAKTYADDKCAETLNSAKGVAGTIVIGTGWSNTNPYTISITANGYTITPKTMVSILPQADILSKMREDGVQAMYITNNNGELTAYAIGNKPTTAITVPVLYTEVK